MTRFRFRLRRPLVLALAVLALAVPTAVAAFVATISNSGNSFQAAAVFPGAVKMASGTYAGNATAGRAIAAGFQPDLVIVKDAGNREAAARTSTMAGDLTKLLGSALILQANDIQALTATGFTIGSGAPVNGNGRTYYWVALKGYSQSMKVGTYTGNATGQAVTGVGFSPEAVMIFGNTAARPAVRFSGASRAYGFDTGTGITGGISSLDADGFTVGTALETNAAATTYHYVAFNKMPNSVDIGTYAGNATDNRNIATVGFQPEYMLVRADDSTTSRQGQARPAALAGDSTLPFSSTAAAANGIQALQAAGFQVGTATDVNANAVNYYYLAVRSSAP